MASGPKTEYLIASYQRSISHDSEQKQQIDQTIAGLEVRTADDENPVHIIEGLVGEGECYLTYQLCQIKN